MTDISVVRSVLLWLELQLELHNNKFTLLTY